MSTAEWELRYERQPGQEPRAEELREVVPVERRRVLAAGLEAGSVGYRGGMFADLIGER